MLGRMWTCGLCGKMFQNRLSRTQHRRTHSVFRPYICTLGVCDKSFSTLSRYQEHRRRHCDHRPYQCGICGARFMSRQHLHSHKCRTNRVKVHGCYICSASFIQIMSLSRHIKTEHPQRRHFQRKGSHKGKIRVKRVEKPQELKNKHTDSDGVNEKAEEEFDKDGNKILLKITAGKSMTIISSSKHSSQESKKRRLRRKSKKKRKRNDKDKRKNGIILSIKNGSVNFSKKKKTRMSKYKCLDNTNGAVRRVIEPVEQWNNLKLTIKTYPEPSISPNITEQKSKSPAKPDNLETASENMSQQTQGLLKSKIRNGIVIHKDKSGNFLSEQLQTKLRKRDRDNVFDSFSDIGMWKVMPSPRTDSPLEVLKLRLSPQKPLRLDSGLDTTFESAKYLDVSPKTKIDNSGEDSDVFGTSPNTDKELDGGMQNVNDSGIEVLSSSSCNRSNGNSVRSVVLDESSPTYFHTEDSLPSYDSPLTEVLSKSEHTICHKCGGIIMEANNNTRSPSNCRCSFSNPNSPCQMPVSPIKSNLPSLNIPKSIKQISDYEQIQQTIESMRLLESEVLKVQSENYTTVKKDLPLKKDDISSQYLFIGEKQLDEGEKSDGGDSDIMVISLGDSSLEKTKAKIESRDKQNRNDTDSTKLRLKLRPRQASTSPGKKGKPDCIINNGVVDQTIVAHTDMDSIVHEETKEKIPDHGAGLTTNKISNCSGTKLASSEKINRITAPTLISPVIVIDDDDEWVTKNEKPNNKRPIFKVSRSMSVESEYKNIEDGTNVKKKPLFKQKKPSHNSIDCVKDLNAELFSKELNMSSLSSEDRRTANKKPLFKKRTISACEESSNENLLNNKRPIFRKKNLSLPPGITSDVMESKLKTENQITDSIMCRTEVDAHSIVQVFCVKDSEKDKDLKLQQNLSNKHVGLVSPSVDKSCDDQCSLFDNKTQLMKPKSKLGMSPNKKMKNDDLANKQMEKNVTNENQSKAEVSPIKTDTKSTLNKKSETTLEKPVIEMASQNKKNAEMNDKSETKSEKQVKVKGSPSTTDTGLSDRNKESETTLEKTEIEMGSQNKKNAEISEVNKKSETKLEKQAKEKEKVSELREKRKMSETQIHMGKTKKTNELCKTKDEIDEGKESLIENKFETKNNNVVLPPSKKLKKDSGSENEEILNTKTGIATNAVDNKKCVESVVVAADEDSLLELPTVVDEPIKVPDKHSKTSPLDLFQQQFLSFLSYNQPPPKKENSKKLTNKRRNTEPEKPTKKSIETEKEKEKDNKHGSEKKTTNDKTSEKAHKQQTSATVKDKKSDSMSWLQIFSSDKGNDSKKKMENGSDKDEVIEFTDDLALINKKIDISDQEEHSLDVDDVFNSEHLSILQPKEEIHPTQNGDKWDDGVASDLKLDSQSDGVSHLAKRRVGRPQKAKRSNPKLSDTVYKQKPKETGTGRPQKAKRSNPKLSDTVCKHKEFDSDTDYSYSCSDADTIDLMSCNGEHGESDPDFNPFHDSDDGDFAPAKPTRRRESIGRRSKQITRNESSDNESKDIFEDENNVNFERSRRAMQGRKSCCPCCLGSPRKSSREHHTHRHRKQTYKMPRNYKQFVKSTVRLLELQGKIHHLFLTLFPNCADLITKSKIGTEEFEMLIDDVLYGLESTDIQFEPLCLSPDLSTVQPCAVPQLNTCQFDKLNPAFSVPNDLPSNIETEKTACNLANIENDITLSAKSQDQSSDQHSGDRVPDDTCRKQLSALDLKAPAICESQSVNDTGSALSSGKIESETREVNHCDQDCNTEPTSGPITNDIPQYSCMTKVESLEKNDLNITENTITQVPNGQATILSPSLTSEFNFVNCVGGSDHVPLQNNQSVENVPFSDLNEIDPIENILESELVITIDLNAARVSLCRDPKNCLTRLHDRLVKLAHCLLPKLEFKNYFYKNIDNLEFLLDLMIKANDKSCAFENDSESSSHEDELILKTENVDNVDNVDNTIELKLALEEVKQENDNGSGDFKQENISPLFSVEGKCDQDLFAQALKSHRESLKRDVFEFEEDDTDKMTKSSEEVLISIESLSKIAKRNRRSRDSRLRKRNADEKRTLFVQEKLQNSHNSTIVCHSKKLGPDLESKIASKSTHPENSKERFLSELSLGDNLGSTEDTCDEKKKSVETVDEVTNMKASDEHESDTIIAPVINDLADEGKLSDLRTNVSDKDGGMEMAEMAEMRKEDGSSETRRKSGDKNIFELMQPSQAADTS